MRYILHPGYVLSSDGDTHLITGAQLASLYGLRLSDCIVIYNDVDPCSIGYREQPGDIHLYPKESGDYKL